MIELLDSDEWTLFLQYDELLEKEGVIKTITTDIPVNKLVSLTSKEVLQIETDQNIEQTTDRESLQTDIQKSLSTVQVRTKDVLEMFFGMGNYERNYSLEEIALKYKVKRERIRQIKEKGIRQLRHSHRKTRLEKYI
jgi:RNA polymerase primary sigma factor